MKYKFEQVEKVDANLIFTMELDDAELHRLLIEEMECTEEQLENLSPQTLANLFLSLMERDGLVIYNFKQAKMDLDVLDIYQTYDPKVEIGD